MNDPEVYIDENNQRMMTNIRNSFGRLATGLIEEGKMDSAVAVIDRGFELVPPEIVPYEYFAIQLASAYFDAGADEKGAKMFRDALSDFNDELNYFFSLSPRFLQTQEINQEIQRTLFYLQRMESTARQNEAQELTTEISESMQQHFESYNSN